MRTVHGPTVAVPGYGPLGMCPLSVEFSEAGVSSERSGGDLLSGGLTV